MQIVIDISKDRYEQIMSMDWKNGRRFFDEEIRAIHDGKALEQQPCEDCVSRQDLREPRFIIAENDYQKGWNDALESVYENAPSIQPQPKIGRWNFTKHYGRDYYVCPICGMERMDDHSRGWNYCPYCGAKMSEIPTGQIVANGELYPGEFDNPLAEEGSEKE